MGRDVAASTVVIDWEAAFAKEYVVSARRRREDPWVRLFDWTTDAARRETVEAGAASPGVADREVKLHHVDTLAVDDGVAFRYLRLDVARPARGWGVSVWQIDVEGVEVAPRRYLRPR